MTREKLLHVECQDCDFNCEFTLDTTDDPMEQGADPAWDHLGKYDEKLSDHTVEAYVVYRYSNVGVS